MALLSSNYYTDPEGSVGNLSSLWSPTTTTQTTAPTQPAWYDLSNQLRSMWSGDWNISGIDRADELAQMLYGNGVTDWSKVGMRTTQGTVSELAPVWEQPSEDAPLYKDVTRDVNVWTYDGQDRIGLLTADGAGKTYGDYLRSNEKGDYEFASSMKGDGNVSYQLVQKADGSYAPVPVWGSSSDMGTVQDILKGAALLGGIYLGAGALGGLEGAAATGAEAAGTAGAGAATAAPASSVQGALSELVGQSMLPSAATMSPELAAGLGELTGQSLVTGAAAIPGLESLSSAAAYDPVAAYYNTGASEGSTMGNAWSGAGGEAGAVGEGSFAGTLADMGPLGGAIDSLGGMIGGSSPIIGPGVNFMNNLPLPENFKKILGKVFSGGKTFNTAKGLAQLYSGYRGMRDNEKMLSGLQGLYSQNSPYAQNLRKQLQRQDAASGRRSQYGPREVELQAKLAQLASGQIPAMNQMYQQQALARNMMLQGGLGLLFGRGG